MEKNRLAKFIDNHLSALDVLLRPLIVYLKPFYFVLLFINDGVYLILFIIELISFITYLFKLIIDLFDKALFLFKLLLPFPVDLFDLLADHPLSTLSIFLFLYQLILLFLQSFGEDSLHFDHLLFSDLDLCL